MMIPHQKQIWRRIRLHSKVMSLRVMGHILGWFRPPLLRHSPWSMPRQNVISVFFSKGTDFYFLRAACQSRSSINTYIYFSEPLDLSIDLRWIWMDA